MPYHFDSFAVGMRHLNQFAECDGFQAVANICADLLRPATLLGQRQRLDGARRSAGIPARGRQPGDALKAGHSAAGTVARQRMGAFEGSGHAHFRHIAGGGIAHAAADHRDHHAIVDGTAGRLGHDVAHAQAFRPFVRAAYRPLAGAGRQAPRGAAGVGFQAGEHGASSWGGAVEAGGADTGPQGGRQP